MSNRIPVLEPSRLGRVRLWVERHDTGFEIALLLGGIIGVCAALPVSIASFYPTSDGGLGNRWWLLINLLPITVGVLTIWYHRGPDYQIEVDGSRYDRDSAYYLLREMRKGWLGLPQSQHDELLPLMRSAYDAARNIELNVSGSSQALRSRAKVIRDIVAENERAAEIERRAMLAFPDEDALEQARILLAGLRERNDVTDEAQQQMDAALRDLLRKP